MANLSVAGIHWWQIRAWRAIYYWRNGIAAAAYEVNGYLNKNVATTIALGFSGQLKNWCDNYLTFDERLAILNHITEELDELGEEI